MSQIDFSFDVSSPTIEIKLGDLNSREYSQFIGIFEGELADVGIEERQLEINRTRESSGSEPEVPGIVEIRVVDLAVNLMDLFKALNRAKALIIVYRVTSAYHAEAGITASRSAVS